MIVEMPVDSPLIFKILSVSSLNLMVKIFLEMLTYSNLFILQRRKQKLQSL